LQKAVQPNGIYRILIGPEGDFTPDEIAQAFEKGFKPVSLGNSRLRTETAGLAACHTFNLLNES
jgi:16S rRNA (uracil1498-N3)-methyltransferase